MSESVPHGSNYIGQRLSFQGHTCTVRYVGTLPETSGSWLGVEWDDPGHGKHDGLHNGVQYFTCLSRSPRAGSFVRPSRPRDPARSFLAAVREKYATDAASYFSVPVIPSSDGDRTDYLGLATPSTNRSISAATTPVRFGNKVAEEVGFAKVAAQQANLQALRIVVLSGWQVCGLLAENEGSDDVTAKRIAQVSETLQSLRELDLGRSLIEAWTSVMEICAGLKQLKVLKLSVNRLRGISSSQTLSPPVMFAGIVELSLDDMLLPWNEIVNVVEQFPSLTKLSLASNNLAATTIPLTASHLKSLNLSFNAISLFSEVSALGSLPSLASLSLQSNALRSLAVPSGFAFPSLATLDLSSNQLSSLAALHPLASTAFPVLTAVRLSHNPFFDDEPPDTSFMLCVAVLPSLQMLNYSRIDVNERLNAELYYLSRVAAALRRVEPGSEAERQIVTENPHFAALVEKHDYGAHLRRSDLQEAKYPPGTLGARLVSLHVTRHPASGEGQLHDTRTVNVPRTISIYALKSHLGRTFGLLPARFQLVWETGEWDPVGRTNVDGDGGEDDEYSVGSSSSALSEEEDATKDSSDSDVEVGGKTGNDHPASSRGKDHSKGRWIRREVLIREGTSTVGFWVDGDEAVVRLEEVEIVGEAPRREE